MKITRAQFERLLGGNFIKILGSNRRANGRYATYKDYSHEVQERVDCFCHDSESNETKSGKNWTQLAKRMGLA